MDDPSGKESWGRRIRCEAGNEGYGAVAVVSSFADDKVVLEGSEMMLLEIADESDRMCKRRVKLARA